MSKFKVGDRVIDGDRIIGTVVALSNALDPFIAWDCQFAPGIYDKDKISFAPREQGRLCRGEKVLIRGTQFTGEVVACGLSSHRSIPQYYAIELTSGEIAACRFSEVSLIGHDNSGSKCDASRPNFKYVIGDKLQAFGDTKRFYVVRAQTVNRAGEVHYTLEDERNYIITLDESELTDYVEKSTY